MSFKYQVKLYLRISIRSFIMVSSIVQTTNLSFSFKPGVPTLQDVNLAVLQGSIYGFLGPNGAGKTTTLRLLLGLLRNQRGSIEIFGKKFSDNRLFILRKLGSLIEQPSLYLHLTAKENLEVFRRIYHCDKKRIDEVLALVGLQETGSKKARQFSLGMKQRLAISIALLHQPELLILDEPTNGLDPNGIIETRELVKKLNKDFGTTILVSSHMLAEVEKVATHVGIIHYGKLLFQGTLNELQQLKERQTLLEMETSDNIRADELLHQKYQSHIAGSKIILPYQSNEVTATINRFLVQQNIDVFSMHPHQNDLEQLFIDITSNGI
jgi:ABC-type multidrug transport system, ATPase component